MEKNTPFWKERETESTIHWPLRDFRKSWTSSVSFGTSSRVSQITCVFHVSMLRRYCYDPSHILPIQDIQVQEDFTFDEESKAILDREIR